MNSYTLILTIAGKPYEMKPEEEEERRRELTAKYPPSTMVRIWDKCTGTFYEKIRMDTLFNY